MNLSGKVLLITGGAQGLGRLFSESLLKKGAKVCIADINQQRGEATLKEFRQQYGDGRAIFVKCDVTEQHQFENVFKIAKSEFGKIDIVCNNAGIAGEDRWKFMVDVNLSAVIQGTLLGIKYMRRDKGGPGGLIVNISSAAGIFPSDFMPVYTATKHGVVGFTRSFALSPNNLETGIRFCTLCPSFANTDIINADKQGAASVLDLQRFQRALKHVGIMEPSTVADAFMDLVEDESNNGTVLAVTKNHGKQIVPQISKL